MMGIFQAIVLGVVQGLTEFLPVSSSAHLVLLPAALGWGQPSLVFDTTVHLGTLAALLAVFWRDLLNIMKSWSQGLISRQPFQTSESRLGWWVVLGTIPAIVAGVLLRDKFESLFSSPRTVGLILLFTATLIVMAELAGRWRRQLGEMNWLDSILIGIGQAAAIAPGLSRSGTTMSVGIFRGLTREASARFSFILAIPIILGAALVQFLELLQSGDVMAEAATLTVGFLAAVISGYLGIRLLLVYVRRKTLYPFAAYCVIVGILAISLL